MAVLRRVPFLVVVLALTGSAALVAPRPAAASPVAGFNGRIAFTHSAGTYPADANGTYTVNADGTGQTQLTHNGGVFATYGRDGSQLAYVSSDGVSEMNADGSNPHVVLPNADPGFHISWSPDGAQFVWMHGEPVAGSINEHSVITVVNADGSGSRDILADDAGSRWYPSWSPDGGSIAFWNAATNPGYIGIVGADGSNERQVVAVANAPDFVSFSPDGTQLVYSEEVQSQQDNNPHVLHVVNVDGTNDHTVGDIARHSAQPTWSPDGEWIAFERGGEGTADGIWVIRADGTDQRQVTHGEDGWPDWQPLAAPQPTYNGKLAIVRSGELYTANADGTGLTDLHAASQWWPSWTRDGTTIGVASASGYTTLAPDGSLGAQHSTTAGAFTSLSPDGTRLAFSRSVADPGSDDIFVSNLDGSSEVDIVARPGPDSFPVWSPDGTKIAFQGISGTNGRAVWIVNADGTDLHVVPNLPAGYAGLPRFSQDGTKLLFGTVAGVGTEPAVWYLIGVDGSGLTQVGPTDRYVNDAAFSPDGTKIVFSSFPVAWSGNTSVTDAATGLYLMNADGTHVVQITHGNDSWVSWQPRLSPPPNLPPRAFGTARNLRPLALLADASASWDFDGTIVAYQWRWGDYTPPSNSEYAWHKYAKAGTYLVRLYVKDNSGAVSTRQAWVKVN